MIEECICTRVEIGLLRAPNCTVHPNALNRARSRNALTPEALGQAIYRLKESRHAAWHGSCPRNFELAKMLNGVIDEHLERLRALLAPSPADGTGGDGAAQAFADYQRLLRVLESIRYTAGTADPTGGDGYVRGTWGDIERALAEGRLTTAEYATIAKAAPVATASAEGCSP